MKTLKTMLQEARTKAVRDAEGNVIKKADQVRTMKKTELNKWTKWLKTQNVSVQILDLIDVLASNGIMDNKSWESIRYGSPSERNRACKNLGLDAATANDIQTLFNVLQKTKRLGELNLVPFTMSEAGRESVMKGLIKFSDLTTDRQSDTGMKDLLKNNVKLIQKFTNEFSTLVDKASLTGVIYEAVFNATRQWLTGDSETKQTFQQYLAYVIRQACLNYTNELNDVVHTGQSAKERGDGAKSFWIDHTRGSNAKDDADEMESDRFDFLGVTQDDSLAKEDDRKMFKQLFNILVQEFSQRDVEMFFKKFGIGGYQQVEGKEIAKEYGVSTAMVSKMTGKIFDYLVANKNKKGIGDVLRTMQAMYTESLLEKLIGCNKKQIAEALMADDLFMYLAEATTNLSKEMVENAINMIDRSTGFVIESAIKNGSVWAARTINANRNNYLTFLEALYPTESVNSYNDEIILNKINNVISLY